MFNGGTVCDDSFGSGSAKAACEKMGYDRHLKYWVGEGWGIQNSYEVMLDEFSCTSSGRDFMEKCSFSLKPNCQHSEDIFVECISE